MDAIGEAMVTTHEKDSEDHSHQSAKAAFHDAQELTSDNGKDWPGE